MYTYIYIYINIVDAYRCLETEGFVAKHVHIHVYTSSMLRYVETEGFVVKHVNTTYSWGSNKEWLYALFCRDLM